MKTLEYRTIDKSDWLDGPWKSEPDKKQWQDPETGLPCLIVRGPHDALCGYVGVPSSHPWHGVGYSECAVPGCTGDADDPEWHGVCTPECRTSVHGGLTFAAPCMTETPESTGVCHLPESGEPDDVWWFGFDCAHYRDLIYLRQGRRCEDADVVYRDVAYVEKECASLARQLAAVAKA